MNKYLRKLCMINPNNNQNQYSYNPNGYNYGYNQFDYNEKLYEKKTLSTVSVTCGLAVVAFAAIGFVASLILMSSDAFMNLYKTNSVFENSFMCLLSVVAVLLPFYFAYVHLKQKNIIFGLELGTPHNTKEFLFLIPIGVMICLIGSALTGIFSTLVDSWFNITFEQPTDYSNYTTASGIIFSFLQSAIIPAFVEEFAIRGVVLQSLRRFGDKFAIIMSALVFALMHGNMVQIPFAFIAGIAFGYIVIKTGTLWSSIIIHFINNSIAVSAMIATDNLATTQANIVLAVMNLSVYIIGAICLFAYIKRYGKKLSGLSNGACRCLSTGEKTTQFIFTLPMLIAIAYLVYETSLYIS